jgi:predicted DNA-binding transcriptional regulator YafY
MLAAMIDTSTRLLRLLSVLQSRRFWPGEELAARLEITTRTLRRDIDRLRSLGYRVAAVTGPGGGYQLGHGSSLPPLLLDDDEAVAVAVALRSAMDTFAGMNETAVGALVKLNQLLPARLRKRASALQSVTVSVRGRGDIVDAELLTELAVACRDCRRVTIKYQDHKGQGSTRTLEPLRLAHTGTRRWYLLAWDLDRNAWRTLRVDRIKTNPVLGPAFAPRPPPSDVERFISDAISSGPYRCRAKFRLAGSIPELGARIPPWIGVLEPLDSTHSVLRTGAETPEAAILQVMLAGVEFELVEPEELRGPLRAISERFQRALGSDGAYSAQARQPPGVP